jgi:hypothetical protein
MNRLIILLCMTIPAFAQIYSYNLNAVSTVTMGSTVSGSMEAHYHYHTTDGNNFSALAATKDITEINNSSFMFLAQHNTSNQLVLRSHRDTNCTPSNELIQSLANKRDIEIVIRRNRVSATNVTVTFELWDKEADPDGFGAYMIATRTCTTSSSLGFSSIRLGDADISNTALGFFRLYTTLGSTGGLPPHARAAGTTSVNLTFDGQNGTESNGKTTSFTSATYSATPAREPVCNAGTTTVYRANAPMVLDGSGSWANDVDVGTLAYSWVVTEQPTGAQLWWDNGSTRADPSISGAVFGQYTFQLTVRQADGQPKTCSIIHGAVPTDDRNVVITGNPDLDKVMGPMKLYGTSEWPWYDRMHRVQADDQGARQGVDYVTTWYTLQSGTVEMNSTGTLITGTGTSFQSEFCGGGTTVSADRYIVLKLVDPVLGTDMYAARRLVKSGDGGTACPSNSQLAVSADPTWTFGAVSAGTQYSSAFTNYSSWAAGAAASNFYDSVLAFYNLYYRSGLTVYRDYARWLADKFIEHPRSQNGYDYYNILPRYQATLGLIVRMWDGDTAHQSRWMTMLNRIWNTTANVIQTGANGYTGTRCCEREDAYRLWWVGTGLMFSDNPTIRANCKQAILDHIFNNLATGSLDSPSTLGGSFAQMFETTERGVTGSSGGFPVWYKWTIPDAGTVTLTPGTNTITLSGSTFSTDTVSNNYVPSSPSTSWVMWSCPTPCSDNDLGDTQMYTQITRTGTTTATMNENYVATSCSPGCDGGRTYWIFNKQVTGDGRSLPGWFEQPYIRLIIWSALDAAREALIQDGDTSNCTYPFGGSSVGCIAAIETMQGQAMDGILSKGLNANEHSVWYSRGSFPCEPSETNPNSDGQAGSYGLCQQPGINPSRTQTVELTRPFSMLWLRTGDTDYKTTWDLYFGKAVGKEGGVSGDAVNYAADLESTAILGKWLGWGFGGQGGPTWDAARVMSMGEWPWVSTSRNVALSARIADVTGAAKVRFTIRDPRGNQVDQDICTSMPCTLTIADSALGRHEMLIEYLDSGNTPIPGATGAWQPVQ